MTGIPRIRVGGRERRTLAILLAGLLGISVAVAAGSVAKRVAVLNSPPGVDGHGLLSIGRQHGQPVARFRERGLEQPSSHRVYVVWLSPPGDHAYPLAPLVPFEGNSFTDSYPIPTAIRHQLKRFRSVEVTAPKAKLLRREIKHAIERHPDRLMLRRIGPAALRGHLAP